MLCFSQRMCRHKIPCARIGVAKRETVGPSIVLKYLLPFGPSHHRRPWSCLMHLGGLDVSVLHIQTETMLNAHTLSMCKYPLQASDVHQTVLHRTCWSH